jgi:DNA-binding CsgD family transcriptional regulator
VLLSLDQVMDEGEIRRRRTEIHRVLHAVGIRHVVAAILQRGADRAIAMSVTRSHAAGPFMGEHTALLERVLPHLASASVVRRRLAAMLAAAEAPAAALHHLDRGVVLVNAAGRMAYANAAAARIMDRRDGLAVDRGGAVVAGRASDTGRLRRAIAVAARAAAGRGLETIAAMSLPRPHGRPYVVQVLPLARESVLAGVSHLGVPPVAALLVSDPDARPASPEQRMREAYGLTVAEAALAARLVGGLSLRETAETLGVSGNTAKTQLKAVFTKLDVDRQTALVHRVLSDLGGVAGSGPIHQGNGKAHER